MKKVGYQVVAQNPVCVDFDDGTVVSYQKGQTFYGDARNPQIARLLRINAIRPLARNEAAPSEIKLGLSEAEESLMKARAARKAQLKASVTEPSTQKKGEVVPASTVKPAKK